MSRAERILSLLSLHVPGWEVSYHDTSGQTVTPQIVAGALAKVSPLAWAIAKVKYADGDIGMIWKAHHKEVVKRAVGWARKDSPTQSPIHFPPNRLKNLVLTAAADCLAGKLCLTCRGTIHEWPESVTCAGCGRTGRREVKESHRYREIGLSRREWQVWKPRYEEICHDILNAHSEALRAVKGL